MKRKRKKSVKMRARTTHGYGLRKKHRGAGSRGGRGMAGSKKHKKVWVIKNMPGHLGKSGFKSLSQRGISPGVKAINIRDMLRLAGKEKTIDLDKMGYDKLLGTGDIKHAITVKATAFTKLAAEKIEKAGGKIIKEGAEEIKEAPEEKKAP
jgi:large subunit ribosomal protein L15